MSYTKLRYDGALCQLYQRINGNSSLYEEMEVPAGGSFTGELNPSWRSQVKAGVSATTSASGRLRTFNPGFIDTGVITFDKNNQVFHDSGMFGSPLPTGIWNYSFLPPDSLVADVTNRSIRKFIDSCDSVRSSIELGQDIGEIKETIHGIIHPLQTLREFTFSHLSRVLKLSKTVKHKASLSKMVADTWLEFRFGWYPLASDIGQAYAGLVNNKDHPNVVPVKGGAFDTFNCFEGVVEQYPWSLGQTNVHLRVTGDYSSSFKGAVRTSQANGRIGLDQMMQLDLPHFVPTIWDLLPYSWIVDYFVNVGDIIKALCFNMNDVSWLKHTLRTTYHYDWSFIQEVYDEPPFVQIINVENTVVNPSALEVSFTRAQATPTDLLPSVQFTLPLGSLRPWENLTALFAGRQKEISRVAKNLR
jgi:hypothetical protein